MSVTGRTLGPAPTIKPTSARGVGGHSARRLETVTFKPAGETKNISFPFLNDGENRRLSILITGFALVEAKPKGPGFGEQFNVTWHFVWPNGVTGENPRKGIGVSVKRGGVTGDRFKEPLNECRPTAVDGETLKVEYRKGEGAATCAAVNLFLQIDEAWEVPEARTLEPSVGAHAVGVARPKLPVVGCNGGTATMPPIEVGRTG